MISKDYVHTLTEAMMANKELFSANSSGKFEVYVSSYVKKPLKHIIPKTFESALHTIAENKNKFFPAPIANALSISELYKWLTLNTLDNHSFDYILYVPEEFWPQFQYESIDSIRHLYVKAYIEMDHNESYHGFEMPLDFHAFDVPLIELIHYSEEDEILKSIYAISDFLQSK